MISSPRFVASTGSNHDDPGPVCRGVVLIGCQLQQLNKAIDVIVIVEPSAVLVFDEYFELDANRLQAQQSRTLIRRVNTQRVTAFDALTTKRQELVFTFTTQRLSRNLTVASRSKTDHLGKDGTDARRNCALKSSQSVNEMTLKSLNVIGNGATR